MEIHQRQWILVGGSLEKEISEQSSFNILSDPVTERPCTPVWKLIKKVLPQFRENISKAPGSGKETKIWTDKIMGTGPRSHIQNLKPLQRWMEANHLISLYHISEWDQSKWQGWKSIHTPIELEKQWHDLQTSLSGAAPIHREKEYRYIWDPSGGKYTVREGYKFLQESTQAANWKLYTAAWKTECIPKIKHFNWTLLKGKVLTAENLKKKGIQGPSICCFCHAEEESSQHIFQQCPQIQHCWSQIVSPLKIEGTFDQISNLQEHWARSYPFSKKGKKIIIRIWKCLPATLCWQIWLSRNDYIFNEKKPNISRIMIKTIALISETISANMAATPDQTDWNTNEQDWFGKFSINYSNNSIIHPSLSRGKSQWKLRGSRDEVNKWIQDQQRHTLHFDGAAKNNPGRAGAGGIIKDTQGKILVRYEWGLGQMSNNQAEAYSLYLGTQFLSRLTIQNPIIVGDSAIVIAAMVKGTDFRKETLNNIKARIEANITGMGSVTFKHVLRENNCEADKHANQASSRPTGHVRENDHYYDKHIP